MYGCADGMPNELNYFVLDDSQMAQSIYQSIKKTPIPRFVPTAPNYCDAPPQHHSYTPEYR